jgi:hypothetical protein
MRTRNLPAILFETLVMLARIILQPSPRCQGQNQASNTDLLGLVNKKVRAELASL